MPISGGGDGGDDNGYYYNDVADTVPEDLLIRLIARYSQTLMQQQQRPIK